MGWESRTWLGREPGLPDLQGHGAVVQNPVEHLPPMLRKDRSLRPKATEREKKGSLIAEGVSAPDQLYGRNPAFLSEQTQRRTFDKFKPRVLPNSKDHRALKTLTLESK